MKSALKQLALSLVIGIAGLLIAIPAWIILVFVLPILDLLEGKK